MVADEDADETEEEAEEEEDAAEKFWLLFPGKDRPGPGPGPELSPSAPESKKMPWSIRYTASTSPAEGVVLPGLAFAFAGNGRVFDRRMGLRLGWFRG